MLFGFVHFECENSLFILEVFEFDSLLFKVFPPERKRKKDPNWVDKRPKKRKPGFHEQMFSETSYYIKNGEFFLLSINGGFIQRSKIDIDCSWPIPKINRVLFID